MMRPTPKRVVVAMVTFAILFAAVGGAIQLILTRHRIHPSGEVYTPAKTPSSWREVQDGLGHAAHLRGARPVACADCHEIVAGTFRPPDATRCAKCHPTIHPTLHKSAPPETRECLTCHPFVLRAGKGTGPWNCIRCHDKAQGAFGAVAVHAKEACGGCHKPHSEPALDPTPCTECHRDQKTRHGSKQGAAVSLCLDCHQPHEKAGAADGKCASCHLAGDHHDKAIPAVPVTALQPGKHERCTGCHKPHQFTRTEVASCRTCHAQQITIGQFTARPHAECTSCHDPHDPRGNVVASCQKCHTTVHPRHPVDATKGTCLGCHDIHPKQVQVGVARACSTCHQKAVSDTGFHLGNTACTACHKAHEFKPLVPDACRTCHQNEARRTATNGHRACTTCHTAHAPKTPPKDCATCHADKSKLVADNKGHQTCRGCHQDPHAPKTTLAACKTCHTDEGASAPKGHAECTGCHEPHRGALVAPPPQVCAKCHADRTTGPHKNVKDSCLSCHRGHGPKGIEKPPPCLSCHQRDALPNLHQKPHHVTCESCHTSHGGPRGDRATCIACHTDRKNHEPTATSCIGCHNFRKAR